VALLKENPVPSDLLAQASGLPRSSGKRIAEQLVERGAAITLSRGTVVEYAPVPPNELLDRLQQEHSAAIASLKEDLQSYAAPLDLNPVWNVEGEANILARAKTMIGEATERIALAALPAGLEVMRPSLDLAIGRGVQIVIYTTSHFDLPGGRVIVTSYAASQLERMSGMGLILIKDGEEALIGEWFAQQRAQASWTRRPTLVAIAEQHLVRGGRQRFPVLAAAHQREGRQTSNVPGAETAALQAIGCL
jgi:sugar-specific transcriptional regulator TrmB